ncbi:MAG: hypothetical protein RJA07_1885 [Bacteroidota bacterium]|jgi:3-hydroxybutyryl-CoA dehydratase
MEVSKFNIGDTFSFQKKILKTDVELYGKVTGDYNPIHFDEEYAKTTRFKKNIVHGMFILGLISNAIGNHLPGIGSIYAAQQIKFTLPVFIDDTITVMITIKEIEIDKFKFILSTTCTNQNNEIVLDGEAKIYNYDI